MIADRIQKFIIRRRYRDDVISRVSAMRDSGDSISSIAKVLNIPESSIRNIIKHIL